VGLEKLKPIASSEMDNIRLAFRDRGTEPGQRTWKLNDMIDGVAQLQVQFVLCEGPNSYPVTGTLIGPGSTILEPEGHCCARHIRVLGRLCEDISHFQV
jgi:hypothetical protein